MRAPPLYTARDGRRFAFPVGAAFAVLAGLMLWRQHGVAMWVFASVAAVLALAGLLVPSRLGPAQRAWMAMAHAISRITTPIVLTAMYVLTIVPTGLVMRALGRDPLAHERDADGFWVDRPADGRRSDLRRQF